MTNDTYKPYHFKSIDIINPNEITLNFYLQYADWDISDQMLKLKIISSNIVKDHYENLKALIEEIIHIEEVDGYLEFWEGEYLEDCHTDTSVPFESYEKTILDKPCVEWRQQYLDLHKEYYSLLGKKTFELSLYKESIINQFEESLLKRKMYLMPDNCLQFVQGVIHEIRNSEPMGQRRKFMYLEESNKEEK